MEVQNIATREMIQNLVDGTTPVAKAINDGEGRNIASTYATKEEVSNSVYWHNIYANAFNVETESSRSFYITIQVRAVSPVKFTAASFLSWLKNNGFTQAAQNYHSCCGVGTAPNNARVLVFCGYDQNDKNEDVILFGGINPGTGNYAVSHLLPDDFANFKDTVYSI